MRKHYIFSAAALIVIPVLVYTASRYISATVFNNSPSVTATGTAGSVEQQQTAPQAKGPIVPYLPPEGLLGPGQVTELTRQNQYIVRSQLRGHQRPVLEFYYSSADPRCKQIEARVEQAAKDYPQVTFIKQDTTKLPVATPIPTINLSIPRPPKDFGRTGYLTEKELRTFIDDGLKSWTPLQPQPTPTPSTKSGEVEHLRLPHFHSEPVRTPGRPLREYQD